MSTYDTPPMTAEEAGYTPRDPSALQQRIDRGYNYGSAVARQDWRQQSTWRDYFKDLGPAVKDGTSSFLEGTAETVSELARPFGGNFIPDHQDSTPEVSNTRTVAGDLLTPVVSFLEAYYTGGKLTEPLKAVEGFVEGKAALAAGTDAKRAYQLAKVAKAAKYGAELARVGVSEFQTATDQTDSSLNTLPHLPFGIGEHVGKPLTDIPGINDLLTEPDDSRFERKLKVGIGGTAFFAAFDGFFKMIRGTRALMKGDYESADKLFAAAKEGVEKSAKVQDLITKAAPITGHEPAENVFTFFAAMARRQKMTVDEYLNNLKDIRKWLNARAPESGDMFPEGVLDTNRGIVPDQELGNTPWSNDGNGRMFNNGGEGVLNKTAGPSPDDELQSAVNKVHDDANVQSLESGQQPAPASGVPSNLNGELDAAAKDIETEKLSSEIQTGPASRGLPADIAEQIDLHNTPWGDISNGDVHAEIDKALKDIDPEVRGFIVNVVGGLQHIIYLTEHADATTLAHELFHYTRRTGLLPKEVIAGLEGAVGVKDGKWTPKADEDAVSLFERWMFEGKASKELAPHLSQMRDIFTSVYQSANEIGKEVSPQVRSYFEQMLGAGDGRAIQSYEAAKSAAGVANQPARRKFTLYHLSPEDLSQKGISLNEAGKSGGEEAKRIVRDESGNITPGSAAVHLGTADYKVEPQILSKAKYLHQIEGEYAYDTTHGPDIIAVNKQLRDEQFTGGNRINEILRRANQDRGVEGIIDLESGFVQHMGDVPSSAITKTTPIEPGSLKAGKPIGEQLGNVAFTRQTVETTSDEALRKLRDPAEGGFSFDLKTGQQPTAGYAFSPYKSREMVIPVEDFDRSAYSKYALLNRDLLSQPNHFMGGWVDSGKVYLDVSVVEPDLNTAMQKAGQADQLAIFDIANKNSINVPPSEGGVLSQKFNAKSSASKKLKPLLTDEQWSQVKSKQTLDRLEQSFKSEVPSEKELLALAKAGVAVKGGYQKFTDSLRTMFGEEDANQIALLNAAFSAQQEVGRHFSDALRMFNFWVDAGRPRDAESARILWERFLVEDSGAIARSTGHKPNVLAVLQNADASALNGGRFSKSANFARNNMGDLSVGTFDTHMAKTTTPEEAVGKSPSDALEVQKRYITGQGPYLAFQARTKQVANQLGWKVAEVQEAAWSAVVAISRMKRLTGWDTPKIMDALRHEHVAQAWDAVKLLKENPLVQEQLKQSGVDASVLSSLSQEQGAFARVNQLAGTAVPTGARRDLGPVIDRLAPASGLTGRNIDFGDLSGQGALFQRARSANKRILDETLGKQLIADAEHARTYGELSDSIDGQLKTHFNYSRVSVTPAMEDIVKLTQKTLDDFIFQRRNGVVPNEITEQFANDLVNKWGVHPDVAKKFLSDNLEDVQKLAVKAVANRKLTLTFFDHQQELAQRAIESGDPAIAKQADEALLNAGDALVMSNNFQTEVARALQSYRIPVDAGKFSQFAKQLDRIKDSLKGNGGPVDQEMMSYVRQAAAMADDPDALSRVFKWWDQQMTLKGNKLLRLHNEWWINSLLGGASTQLVNATTNLGMTFLLPMTRMVGGAFRMDPAQVMSGMRAYVNMFHTIADTFRWTGMGLKMNPDSPVATAFKAFKQDSPVLSQITKMDYERAWSAKFIGIDAAKHPVLATGTDWLGNAINLPTRTLMSIDEFFRQLNYRGWLREEAMQAAQRQGINDPSALGSFINRYIEDGFDHATGAAREGTMAWKMAQRSTFTQDFIEGTLTQKLSQLHHQHPAMALVMPFFRVPVNLFKTLRDYSPLAPAFKAFRDELTHPNPAIRSDAWGRLMLGNMFWMGAGMLATSGMITGGGPRDKGLRDAKLATGWQPYSIRMRNADGTENYISYARLDPFSSLLGIAGDYAESYSLLGKDDQESIPMSMAVSLAKNLTNKTYVKTLSEIFNVLSNPDPSVIKWSQERLAGYLPRMGTQFNSDDYLRETRTYMDGVLRRVPGYGEGLPPKRDLFGDPINAPNGYLLDIFRHSNRIGEPVKEELAKMDYGFTQPPKKFRGVDLSMIKDDNGRDAYDYYLEQQGHATIGGKNLADSLSDIIKSPAYKRMPDPDGYGAENYDNPKVRTIQRIIGSYRALAAYKMRQKYPQVDQMISTIERQKIDAMRPKSPALMVLDR